MKKKQESMIGKVGGQALIEGVMMRGVTNGAMAVRLPTGEIDVEEWTLNKPKMWNKIPIIRGIVSFITSLLEGYRCLSKSAEKAGLEEGDEEPSKFEAFLERKLGDNLMKVVIVIGVVLGMILAVGLFLFLPSLIVKSLDSLLPLGGFKALIEGIIKIVLFVSYLAVVSQMKDIKRVFEYHGAEHKTIFCFEAGEELTVENVKKQSRFHPRCGTSFLIIILILSILVFSVVTWDSLLIRNALKIVLLPLILGVAYELIKFSGRHDNWFTRAVSYPGIKLQLLTTKEPDASQIEVAIAALKPCVVELKEEEKDEMRKLQAKRKSPIPATNEHGHVN